MKLGKSQRAVVDFMKRTGCAVTAGVIGDALYDDTSQCSPKFTGKGKLANDGYGMGGKATPSEIRRAWASKILSILHRKGVVAPERYKITTFTQGMLKRGYLASSQFYASIAHRPALIREYGKNVTEVFCGIAAGTYRLEGEPARPGFQRLA